LLVHRLHHPWQPPPRCVPSCRCRTPNACHHPEWRTTNWSHRLKHKTHGTQLG